MAIYLRFCRAADRESSLGYSFAEMPKGRRSLDLNQRPLGYESCVSGSAQAYPLVTGLVRSREIGSGRLTWAKVGQKLPRPKSTRFP
jgi:hypothetical protein